MYRSNAWEWLVLLLLENQPSDSRPPDSGRIGPRHPNVPLSPGTLWILFSLPPHPIVLWDHHPLYHPWLTETLLCNAWLYLAWRREDMPCLVTHTQLYAPDYLFCAFVHVWPYCISLSSMDNSCSFFKFQAKRQLLREGFYGLRVGYTPLRCSSITLHVSLLLPYLCCFMYLCVWLLYQNVSYLRGGTVSGWPWCIHYLCHRSGT